MTSTRASDFITATAIKAHRNEKEIKNKKWDVYIVLHKAERIKGSVQEEMDNKTQCRGMRGKERLERAEWSRSAGGTRLWWTIYLRGGKK